jgi:hypothetical protein
MEEVPDVVGIAILRYYDNAIFGEDALKALDDGEGIVEVVEAFIEDQNVEGARGRVAVDVGPKKFGGAILVGGSQADSLGGEVEAEVAGVVVGAEALLEDACAATDVQNRAAGFVEGVIAHENTVMSELIDGFEVFPLFAGILGVPVFAGVEGRRVGGGLTEVNGGLRGAKNAKGPAGNAFEEGGHGCSSRLKESSCRGT